MRYQSVPTVLVCAAAAATAGFVVTKVHAAEYMSVADSQRVMFADATEFVPLVVALNPDQLKQLAERAGGPPRMGAWRIWQARQGSNLLGYVVADAVIGKFELINYAVALSPAGEIRDVEILAYRESHGYEVRNKPWRSQFTGKSAQSPLRIGDDIQNISGATLSCTHITDGIRRIAVMAQMALAKG
ncbi:FMN-binding protein [Cupriavidus basilensis]|uniref:FMN-binding protein n=1 Tax=Cupriavidus basilensis TaxID=68895 RepID=A0ABT6AGR6_9BURK|nr:FMN-binding protein [Cupriavidus basilensis]MDF3831802.1 FMN-binding protein [Cupriavidus basilensis]